MQSHNHPNNHWYYDAESDPSAAPHPTSPVDNRSTFIMQSHNHPNEQGYYDAESDPSVAPPSLMSPASPGFHGGPMRLSIPHSGYTGVPHQGSPSDYGPSNLYSPTISPNLTQEYSHPMAWDPSQASHHNNAVPGNAYMTQYPSSQYPEPGAGGYIQEPVYAPAPPVTGEPYYDEPTTGECNTGQPPETGMVYTEFAEPGYPDYDPDSQGSHLVGSYEHDPSRHLGFDTPSESLNASFNNIQTYDAPEPNGCLAGIAVATTRAVDRALRPKRKRPDQPSSHQHHHNQSNDGLPCGQCDKVFSGKYRSGNRNRHVKHLHRSFSPLQCRACDSSFRRSDARRKHEKSQHGMHKESNPAGSSSSSVTPPSSAVELDGTAIAPSYSYDS